MKLLNDKNQHFFPAAGQSKRIYVRKSPKKIFWKKNLEIKTLVKVSEFSEVLGQNVTGNKVLSFRLLELFFLK